MNGVRRISKRAALLFLLATGIHPTINVAAPTIESDEVWLDNAPIDDLRGRIDVLSPGDPLAYFELAEEVASEIHNVKGHALAKRLYVLAFEYDRQVPAPIGLGASVCLALVEITPREADKRWLYAMAASLGSTYHTPLAAGADLSQASLKTKVGLAKALELYREGEYRLSLKQLADPAVGALLESASGLLEHGSEEILAELATEPVCHECKNRRIVLADLGPNREYRLCYTCDGDPGPDLTDEQLIEQLRVEKTLLSDKPQSWSAALRLTRAKPLRDVDPDELAPWAGVDVQQRR